MNAIKYAMAVAVMALSATVSAQIVYVPDFPVKKAVVAETANAESQAPAADTTEVVTNTEKKA
ncbi:MULTISPECIES: hypothetical protein [unclassified Acinetobacter]|uniref:hypothetical protein n=1 Tax=unclassified Acinetobacter TaxID=196816 RepID=UPI0015D29401|nr:MULTISPECIES: hypothetical protein [unclassified Acinetobacter]UUS64947.1 hypothetical protein MST18_14125 [Acinetobacter sp. YH12068_T]